MLKLDDSMRRISLQFNCKSESVVPSSIPRYDDTPEMEATRAMYTGNGERVLGPTKNVSLVELFDGLTNQGFDMVGAFCQKRQVPMARYERPRPPRYTVRFTFVRREDVKRPDDSEELTAWQNKCQLFHNALAEMCKESLWRTTVFKNPFFKDHEPVEGITAVSINLDERTPLYNTDGSPQMRWQKDGNGERVGDAPRLLCPEHLLVVRENCLGLAPLGE